MAYYSSTKLCVCGEGGWGEHIILRIKVIHMHSHSLISRGSYTCGTRIWPRNCVLTLVYNPAGCNLYIYVQTTVHYRSMVFVICTLSVYLLYSQWQSPTCMICTLSVYLLYSQWQSPRCMSYPTTKPDE